MSEQENNRGDKLEAGEIQLHGKFAKWIDNFWFYHKWKVIIGLFALIVVLVCTLQMCQNVSDDIMLMYAGPYYFATADVTLIRDAFNDVMPTDFNNDGEKNTDIAALNIYSEEQIKERLELASTDSQYVEVNTYINNREFQSFKNLIVAGEYSVCLLDPWLYEYTKASGGFRKLSDVLGETPDCAYDEYAVRFMDTDFAKAHADAFVNMPADTLICLRTESTIGSLLTNNKTEKTYSYAEEMFRAIIGYKSAE